MHSTPGAPGGRARRVTIPAVGDEESTSLQRSWSYRACHRSVGSGGTRGDDASTTVATSRTTTTRPSAPIGMNRECDSRRVRAGELHGGA